MAQTASPSGYALNPFAAQTAGAQALRSYAPNPFAGSSQGVPGQMAAHLSQAPNLDQYLLQAYREMHVDPQAKQYEQTTPDVDKLWRFSPNSPLFRAGYAHNPYVMARADALRTAATQPAQEYITLSGGDNEGQVINKYITDESGQQVINPVYVRLTDPDREGGSD